MTTKQIELRTEATRKLRVMQRLELPGERMAFSAVVVLLCAGFGAALALAYFVTRAM